MYQQRARACVAVGALFLLAASPAQVLAERVKVYPTQGEPKTGELVERVPGSHIILQDDSGVRYRIEAALVRSVEPIKSAPVRVMQAPTPLAAPASALPQPSAAPARAAQAVPSAPVTPARAAQVVTSAPAAPARATPASIASAPSPREAPAANAPAAPAASASDVHARDAAAAAKPPSAPARHVEAAAPAFAQAASAPAAPETTTPRAASGRFARRSSDASDRVVAAPALPPLSEATRAALVNGLMAERVHWQAQYTGIATPTLLIVLGLGAIAGGIGLTVVEENMTGCQSDSYPSATDDWSRCDVHPYSTLGAATVALGGISLLTGVGLLAHRTSDSRQSNELQRIDDQLRNLGVQASVVPWVGAAGGPSAGLRGHVTF